MPAVRITTAHNEARLTGTLDFLNLGSGVATIEIYGNTKRTDVTDSPGADPLVIMELDDPAGTVASNVLTLAAGADALIDNSGTAVWARLVNANGDDAGDMDVSDVAGSGAIKLPSTTLYAGGITRLVSGVLG